MHDLTGLTQRNPVKIPAANAAVRTDAELSRSLHPCDHADHRAIRQVSTALPNGAIIATVAGNAPCDGIHGNERCLGCL